MSTVEETLIQARRLHQAGHLGEAELLYGEILQAEPEHGEALFLLGTLCGQQSRFEEALGHFRLALARARTTRA